MLTIFANTIGISIKRSTPVSGGDINEAFKIETDDNKIYFLKINDNFRYPEMFEKEATGLKILKSSCHLAVPNVVQCGITDNRQYLMLEWIERGVPAKDCSEDFGKAIAEMHKIPQSYFGFYKDNYIGSLKQINAQHQDWSSFYTHCRMMPLIKKLFENHYISLADVAQAENFCKLLDDIFPAESPSLLHGDLWAGNFMIDQNGYAAIYDPAVYFGHREMDIGMSRLFGGFSKEFYDGYSETYPLEKNWQKRLPYTQLYPLLVHALLFGGHYIRSVKEVFKEF